MAPKITGNPAAASMTAAASAFAVAHGMTPGGGTAWKLDCAYQACKRKFDPHGVGPWHHGSCPVGSVFATPLGKAEKDHGKDSLEYGEQLKIAQAYAVKLEAERKAAAEAAKAS